MVPGSTWARRKLSVPLVGLGFCGLSLLMFLGVLTTGFVSAKLGISLDKAVGLPNHVLRLIGGSQIGLGVLILIVSLRFLQLRRWTRLPLLVISHLLFLTVLGFAATWVIVITAFFSKMRGGPPDPVWTVITVCFQVAMTLGGVVVSFAFALGLRILGRYLRSSAVRELVTVGGF